MHAHAAVRRCHAVRTAKGFRSSRGLKIDFVLATPSLAGRVTGAFIDRDERAGQGASDHAPVVVDLSD